MTIFTVVSKDFKSRGKDNRGRSTRAILFNTAITRHLIPTKTHGVTIRRGVRSAKIKKKQGSERVETPCSTCSRRATNKKRETDRLMGRGTDRNAIRCSRREEVHDLAETC